MSSRKRTDPFAPSNAKRLGASSLEEYENEAQKLSDTLILGSDNDESSYSDSPVRGGGAGDEEELSEEKPKSPRGPERRNTRGRAFLGTWNNYEEIPNWKSKFLEADEWVYQVEIGKDAEKPHLQFAVYWKNKRDFSSVRSLFPGAHIEIAKSKVKAFQYCRKKDTRVEGPFSSSDRPPLKDPLAGCALRDFQREVLSLLDTQPDTRTIHWFVDPVGNAGKTSLAKHICLNMEGSLYLTGKAADMKYGCFSYVENPKNPVLRVVLVDLVRTTENFFSYQGLEEVKNGIFYNTKYESKMCLYDSPHVVVFSNWLPTMDKLSLDRWNIRTIEDGKTIPFQW